MGLRVWGFGLRVWGLGLRGGRCRGPEFRDDGLDFKIGVVI